MNIEWIKNKSNEKFYPVSHSEAIIYDSTGKTVKAVVDSKLGTNNITNSISASSTSSQVPSASAVWSLFNSITNADSKSY